MNYKIYTDGAYSQMNDEGAFAFVILDEQENVVKSYAKKVVHETNNRAELKAIIGAVHQLPDDAKTVNIYSDSQYALNTLRGHWGHRNNHDLFDIWFDILNKRKEVVLKYNWVRGHNGDKYNELCDKMCNDVLGYDTNAEFEKYKKK